MGKYMLIVVAALIKKEDKILLARRSTGDASVLGKWEFPGGKLNSGETEEQAVEREIFEEFELKVKATKFLTHTIYTDLLKTIDLKLYECQYLDGQICLHDHYEYQWVTKKDLLQFDLAPADLFLVNSIMEYEDVL